MVGILDCKQIKNILFEQMMKNRAMPIWPVSLSNKSKANIDKKDDFSRNPRKIIYDTVDKVF